MTANHISPLTNSSKWDSDKCLLLPDERDDDSPLIPEEGEHESAPVITNHSDHTPADVAVNGATETCPPVVHESSHPPGTECRVDSEASTLRFLLQTKVQITCTCRSKVV